MRVLFLTNSIGYGGAEKIMNFVTHSLSEAGHDVTIFNIDAVPTDIAQVKQSIDAKIRIVNRKHDNGNRHISIIKQVCSIIRSNKIDLMIAFTMFPNFYAKIASLITGVPSIMSERGNPYITFTDSFKDKILKFFINRSRGAVFQTKEASLFYSKALRNRGIVIPNPISVRGNEIPQVLAHQRDKTIVSVGRLQNSQKRMDIMLNAFSIFHKQHPDYTLIMYGSGEDNYVRALSEKLGIEDKVILKGAVENPMQKIYRDGIFLITSDFEGIPNALLEAMAAGLPVVSTDCSPGGARLLIQNEENGLIVPRGDIDAVAKALSRFAEDEQLADYCSNNARKVVSRFSPSLISQKWLEYINTIKKHQPHDR